MKKIGIRVGGMLLALIMIVSLLPFAAFAAEFQDTDGHWAETSIDRWTELGLINGVSESQFSPDGNMTRAQVAQIFANLLKLTAKADLSAYTDVPADAWYADALAACVEAGILKGVGDGLLNPEGTLTREMFFVMCARALSIPEEATLSKEFADSSAISDWAKGSIYALINHGYIAGTTSDTVSPDGLMTRGSAMVLMDRMIAAYVTESGTVAVEQDGAVVVLADNVTLTGSADVVVSVYAEDASVSLKGFNGNARVVAQRDGVTVTNAPAGTVIEAAEGVEGTKANGQQLAADSEVVISGGTTSGGGGGGGSSSQSNDARDAADAAWDDLEKALNGITGHDGAVLVKAGHEGSAYSLTLNVDAIQAGTGAFGDDLLNGLATRIGEALNEHFGACTLTADGQDIYVNGKFQNTALKNALFNVADGFFVTLAGMEADAEGVYTYKSIEGAVTASSDNSTYQLSLDVQLRGSDVEKVQELARTLADHLQMEKLSGAEITERYGIEVSENEAIVVTAEMPDALMQKAVEIAEDKGISADDMQARFNTVTIGAYLDLMKDFQLSDILGSQADSVNSVLSTVNANANLVNKILSKLDVSVKGTALIDGEFTPETGNDEWQKFVNAAAAMLSEEILGQTPGAYASTGTSGDTYYAVPVTVDIDLQSSLGFQASETVVVVLHIDFSAYAN